MNENKKQNKQKKSMKQKVKITEAQLRKLVRNTLLSETQRYWFNDRKNITTALNKIYEGRNIFFDKAYVELLKMTQDESNRKLIQQYAKQLDKLSQLGDYLYSALESEWSRKGWKEEPESIE